MASSPVLTSLITSPRDLRRARRELESLDEFLHQSALRQGGKVVKLPTISRMLEELAADSDLNLLKKTDRDRLDKFIVLLTQKAPVLHISFASEPSSKAMAKLIDWLRENIHPQVVISIGIQPSIAAGCVVRTPNRQFDLSLRQALDNQTASFVNNLRAGEETAAPVTTGTAT
jgi:F0F1-type ATP synthase delta subunit